MSDIVERLRDPPNDHPVTLQELNEEAGAEIERLRAELHSVHAHLQYYRDLVDGLRARNAELVAALREIAERTGAEAEDCVATEIARAALAKAEAGS